MFQKPREVMLAETILEAPHTVPKIPPSELQMMAKWVVNQWQVVSMNGMLEEEYLQAAHEDNLDQQREEHGSEHYTG